MQTKHLKEGDNLKFREVKLAEDKNIVRFLFFTDTHYNATSPRNRLDNLLETSLEKTREIIDLACQYKVDFMVHGGDFFEKPDVTDLVAGRVASVIKNIPVPFFVVPGGHDLYGNNIETVGRTKIGLLSQAGLVNLLTHPLREAVIFRNSKISVQLTGTASHYGIDSENIENDYILQYKQADFAVHAVHGMLVPKPFIPGIPAVLVDNVINTQADITLAGHYHLGYDPVRIGDKLFVNCGALVRKTNDIKEMSRIPQVALITISKEEGVKVEFISLKSALPGDQVLDRSELERQQHFHEVRQSFVNQIRKTQNIQSLNIDAIVRELADNKNLPKETVKDVLERISKVREIMGDREPAGNGTPKYLAKVILHNFQSHAYTEVDLVDGINVFLGPSDNGKTAVMRAIRWVLFNEPRGSDFVRHGEDECYVTLVMSDGYAVTRMKRKNRNIYSVKYPDGKILNFENFGTDVPAEVFEATGVSKVLIDTDKEFALNISGQLDAPFLLSESGAVKAKAIGSIVKTHLLDAAERDVQREIGQVNAEIKGIEEQIENADKMIASFGDMGKLEETVNKIESLIERLKVINTSVEKLIYLKNKVSAIETELKVNESILKELQILPDIEVTYLQLKEMFKTWQHLQTLQGKLKARVQELENNRIFLAKVKDLNALEVKVEKLSSLFFQQQMLEKQHKGLTSVKKEIETQSVILRKLQGLTQLEQAVVKLEGLFSKQKELKNRERIKEAVEGELTKQKMLLGKLKNVPLLEEKFFKVGETTSRLQKLMDLAEKKKANAESIMKGIQYIKKVDYELNVVADRYVAELKKIGKCPTCLHEISGEEIERISKELKGVM